VYDAGQHGERKFRGGDGDKGPGAVERVTNLYLPKPQLQGGHGGGKVVGRCGKGSGRMHEVRYLGQESTDFGRRSKDRKWTLGNSELLISGTDDR